MIGIMSDSHDNLPAVKQAVRLFNDAQCKLVIHAGDFIAPFAARELANLHCPVKAVFGNCDGEKKGLKKEFAAFGEIKEAPLIFNFSDLDFLVTHIHVSVDSYLFSGKYDVIVFGHTHKPEIKQKDEILLVNPGETGGWVSEKRTVSLLDPVKRSAEIVTL